MPVKREPGTDAMQPGNPAGNDREPDESNENRQKARAEAIKRLTEIRRAFAWPLHRVPLLKHPASSYVGNQRKAKLVLPRSYRSGDGSDTKFVRAEEDLNTVVYNWYDERVEANDEQAKKGVNFVAKDGVISRRHEYLGPDPRVAGYEVGRDGNIQIRWWDGFLQDQWVAKDKWKIDVICDDNGSWVESSP